MRRTLLRAAGHAIMENQISQLSNLALEIREVVNLTLDQNLRDSLEDIQRANLKPRHAYER